MTLALCVLILYADKPDFEFDKMMSEKKMPVLKKKESNEDRAYLPTESEIMLEINGILLINFAGVA